MDKWPASFSNGRVAGDQSKVDFIKQNIVRRKLHFVGIQENKKSTFTVNWLIF